MPLPGAIRAELFVVEQRVEVVVPRVHSGGRDRLVFSGKSALAKPRRLSMKRRNASYSSGPTKQPVNCPWLDTATAVRWSYMR